MFTGLIENIGILQKRFRQGGAWRLFIASSFPKDEPLVLGESVAVDGVCLTVCDFDENGFYADLLNETLRRTSLGDLSLGANVNLERAMKAGGRMGGHIVQGHVDETGRVLSVTKTNRDYELRIACSPALARLCVMKGSIAINGTSLTITDLGDDFLAVNIIPHTWKMTSMDGLSLGKRVNLESDIVGKYIDRLLSFGHGECKNAATSILTEESLRRAGF